MFMRNYNLRKLKFSLSSSVSKQDQAGWLITDLTKEVLFKFGYLRHKKFHKINVEVTQNTLDRSDIPGSV